MEKPKFKKGDIVVFKGCCQMQSKDYPKFKEYECKHCKESWYRDPQHYIFHKGMKAKVLSAFFSKKRGHILYNLLINGKRTGANCFDYYRIHLAFKKVKRK